MFALSVILFFIIFVVIIYNYDNKPGVLLVYILFFTFVSDVSLYFMNVLTYKYYLNLVIIFLIINKIINKKNLNYNIVNLLRSNIFWGILLILVGMLVGYFNNGFTNSANHMVSKFLIPIMFLFLTASIVISNKEILEEMSFGILIFGIIFYISFYTLFNPSVIDSSNRDTIGLTIDLFNSITLSRINGMFLISSFFYFLYTKSRSIRIISIFISLLSLYWILITSTRGVIISIIISLLLYFLLKTKNPKNFLYYLVSILFFTLIIDKVLSLSEFGIKNRFIELKYYYQMPRYWDYFRTWDIFKENIIFGAGPGGYGRITGRGYPHNIYLEMIAEYGLLGFIAELLIIGTSLYNSIKILKNNIFSFKIEILIILWFYFALAATFSGNLVINNYFWILSGVMISIIRIAKYQKH